MNIFIHSIIIGKTFPLDLQPSDTIENVKAKSQDHEGVPSSHQRIYLATIELKDGKVLSDYDIGNNATLEMKLQLNART